MKKCFIRNIRGEKTALTPGRRKRHLQTETLVNEEIEIEIDWVNLVEGGGWRVEGGGWRVEGGGYTKKRSM